MSHEHGRGKVRHNALAALVTSKTFRSRAERPKKGRAAFQRKPKHTKISDYGHGQRDCLLP